MQHLQPNTTLQGWKYRIERVLGQGGFGITYLAIQTSLNRQVAIKELFLGGSGQAINDRNGNNVIVTNPANQSCFDQQKERFKKEAKRLADLHHPNLVKVHEFFEENDTAYYVMDYIEGESLRSKLNREGRITESQVLKYLQQLTNVLEVTHQHSLWHLDIKPENIMVDKYGHITLIDFGSSKHIEQGGTLTTSSMLAYTPGYYPPEQAVQTMRNIGPWTDIYALGATLYNLLTNRTPPSHDEILCDGRSAFSFPYPVSSSTQEMIIQMMKPNRKERPQTVAEIQNVSRPTNDSSEDTLIDNPHPKRPTAPKPMPAPQPSSNNSLIWVVAIVIIVGFVIWIASRQNNNNTANTPQKPVQTESESSKVISNDSRQARMSDNNITKSLILNGDAEGFPIILQLQINGDDVSGTFKNVTYGTQMNVSGHYINNTLKLSGQADGLTYTINLKEGIDGIFEGIFSSSNGNRLKAKFYTGTPGVGKRTESFNWNGIYSTVKDAGNTYGGTPIIFGITFTLKAINDSKYEGTMEISGFQTYFDKAKIEGTVYGNRIRIYYVSSRGDETDEWSVVCDRGTLLLSMVYSNGEIDAEWFAPLCESEVVDQDTPVIKE